MLFVLILTACQTNEPKETKLSEEQPEIKVEINGEQLNANTRIYCWNDCDNGGDMGTINLPELTEGVEVVSVSPKSEVKVSVNGSDTPTTIGYFKQQNSDFTEKTIENNTFEIYGLEGIQYYLIVVDWYDESNSKLLGRATTPFVVEIDENE